MVVLFPHMLLSMRNVSDLEWDLCSGGQRCVQSFSDEGLGKHNLELGQTHQILGS